MVRRFSFVLVGLLLGLGCSKSDEAKPAEHKPVATEAAQLAAPQKAPAKCSPGPDGRCEPSATCSASCVQLVTPECAECEATSDCAEFADSCSAAELSEEDRALCVELMSCVQTTGCMQGQASAGSCYCGTLPHEKCRDAPLTGTTAPSGACRDLILKGLPQAKTSTQVLAMLTMRTQPTGYALSRLNCLKRGSRGTCSARCGFGPR